MKQNRNTRITILNRNHLKADLGSETFRPLEPSVFQGRTRTQVRCVRKQNYGWREDNAE